MKIEWKLLDIVRVIFISLRGALSLCLHSIVCHYCFIHLIKRIHSFTSSSIQVQSVSVYSSVVSIKF
jgi:hypothetical protein